jgi:branched-subunit amino acid ABC-type transport system permease component
MVEITLPLLIEVLKNALIAGGIYSLISVGYNLIYGILRFINFAHGEIVALGAFLAFMLVSAGLPLHSSAALAIAATSAAGILIERAVYRPLRNAPRLSLLVAAISLSIVIQSLLLLYFGADVRSMPREPAIPMEFAGAAITQVQLMIIAASVVMVALIEIFLKKTKLGREIRAAADNPELAKTIGIDNDRVIMMSFALASALGAVAGILSAMDHSFNYLMGVNIGIKAFTASVMGGIGSIPGSFIGGYLLGIAENFGVLFIPSGYKDAISFLLLILFLLIRPGGIMGSEVRRA